MEMAESPSETPSATGGAPLSTTAAAAIGTPLKSTSVVEASTPRMTTNSAPTTAHESPDGGIVLVGMNMQLNTPAPPKTPPQSIVRTRFGDDKSSRAVPPSMASLSPSTPDSAARRRRRSMTPLHIVSSSQDEKSTTTTQQQQQSPSPRKSPTNKRQRIQSLNELDNQMVLVPNKIDQRVKSMTELDDRMMIVPAADSDGEINTTPPPQSTTTTTTTASTTATMTTETPAAVKQPHQYLSPPRKSSTDRALSPDFLSTPVRQTQSWSHLPSPSPRSCLKSPAPKRTMFGTPKRNVEFRTVVVRQYERAHAGGSGVPDSGHYTLGLTWQVVKEEQRDIIEYERHRKLGGLGVVPESVRKQLLHGSVDDELLSKHKQELTQIRRSRANVGCACTGPNQCIINRCVCFKNGIECLGDACSCTNGCRNQFGKITFSQEENQAYRMQQLVALRKREPFVYNEQEERELQEQLNSPAPASPFSKQQ
jgi:hypothetical protein